MRRLVVVALVVAACSSGAPAPTIRLDGSPHPATDAGIVTTAERHRVVVDGSRTYSVNPRLLVFDPGTLQLAPLAGTLGRYALIGAHGSRVDWIEPLSVVARLPGSPPVVLFFGTLVRVVGAQATFADGTVLAVEPGVTAPAAPPVRVRADVDPARHAVRALTAA